MNNEPIAYIPDTGLKTLQDGSWCVANADKMGDSDIPLYTHPVNPYQSITNTKIEPTVVSYTHPVNTCKHGVDDGACKECYIKEQEK